MATIKKMLFASLQFFAFSAGHCFAQAPHLFFKHITSEQGLSNTTIENIFQDKRGFMWFGTRDGLNRYDGNQIVVYRYDAKDSNSISDNYIHYLYQDREGHLWVATSNGLNRLNEAKNTFTRFKNAAGNNKTLSNNNVSCISEDKKGNLWVSTLGGGINLFKPADNTFLHFRHTPGKAASVSSDTVNYLFQDSEDNFWVGTKNGLNLFYPESGNFEWYKNAGNGAAIHSINIIKEGRRGNLWLGTEENGVLRFNHKENEFTRYGHAEKDPRSLSGNQVRSILVDKAQNVWIGSVNGGLDLFDETSGSFFHYQNEPENSTSLSQRTVSALLEDNQGNMWAGTHRGGVNLYMPNTEKFKLYRQDAQENSLSYNDVKAFYEDADANLWIGTDGGGLNLFDRKNNTYQHYKNSPFNNSTIGSNEVLNIMEDSQGNLWIGTWGGGLNLFNKKAGSFTRYQNDSSNPFSISSNYIQKIFEDSHKNLWIATYYGGLNLFDRKTNRFSRIAEAPDKRSHLQGNNIIAIDEDREGNIWIGTDDGGLNCLEAATKSFTHYFDKEEKKPDLRVLFFDSKNRLWVGQKGLYLFDAAQKTFTLYTDKAGLATEFIKGIAEDGHGDFWISTSNGLTQFNPNTYQFKKYNTADGLQGLEYEANAYLKAKDGQLFFGGLNGFNSFYPKNIRANTFIPPVYITDLQLSNTKVLPRQNNSPLQSDISFTDTIILSYKQATFSFGFAGLNYTAAENNQFASKLENWDKDWNYTGNDRKASYINVKPGTYIFKVKAANNDGVWNEQGRAITIIITPPFWDTWWFKLLVFLIAAIAVYQFYQFRQKLRQTKMEETKREEMRQVQLQFFTNISHEFRTPLTLILGPIEKLQREETRPAVSHNYKVIQSNANRLLSLINELMDFRKSESGALQLNVMPGNLEVFLNEIAEEFSELALQKNMAFTIKPVAISEVWFDRQVLEKIIINLLSNAFKYTKDNGTITLEVLASLNNFVPAYQDELIIKNNYEGKRYIFLRVADNGIGISKESIMHLFERYYKISESHLGSGVGLAFVKSLTLLHKGKIYVYSERNKGTEIIIALPVSKDDYDTKERWLTNKEGSTGLQSIELTGPPYFPAVQPAQATETSASVQKKPHILLVDDNEELRFFLKESLEEEYMISEAVDGNSGLQKAREEMPDIIVSDVMMPGMDGIEFCRLIKDDAVTSHIPFFILTAKDALQSRLEGVSSGADFYFAKPLSIQLLQLTIRNTLSQKQKLRERYVNDQHAISKDLVHAAKDKEFIDELITAVEEHLTNPDMDVDYICVQMGMSRTKLYTKIKNITGQSINDFIRTIRLKKAVHLMTTDDMPLVDVMYSVGIQTQSYFTKAFKKEFGKTPSQFLKGLNK